jgi:hypothetical protein
MNEQQIKELTNLIYDEDPIAIRNFILETLPEEQVRQDFILGNQAVELFREADNENKIASAQAILDLLPNVDLQRQFLERVGTIHEGERDNAHSIFSLVLTYGSVELVQQEIDNPRYELLDLILDEGGTNGFIDAVNFHKQEVVDIILRSLESQNDRITLINTIFEGISNNFGEDQDAANMVETILDVLDSEHQRILVLSQIGGQAFESMVSNDHINTVNLMLASLENDEQRQDLVSRIDRNTEYESEEMRKILDVFEQIVSDEYESSASYYPESDNDQNGSEVENNEEDLDETLQSETSIDQEESESKSQEIDNKRKSPSRSPSPTSSKKFRGEEHDKEDGQGI